MNNKSKSEYERIEKEVQALLFAKQDIPYKEFQSKLIPTVDPKTIIGVRTPDLRKLAKDFSKTDDAQIFLQMIPHKFYEENNLHGFLIETLKDFDATISAIDNFLPIVDNWATCDIVSPKVLKKYPAEFLPHVKRWIASDKTYTIRFGIEMLMRDFLDENFSPDFLKLVAAIKSDEYYVNMMIAWYFATALAKQYDATIPFIEKHKLDAWTHNKAIQKSIESYRITDEQKTYLRTLKVDLKK